jgi:hypothetical protein
VLRPRRQHYCYGRLGARRPWPTIYVFMPAGRVLETHAVPANRPTNGAFGGPDLAEFYVTTCSGHVFVALGPAGICAGARLTPRTAIRRAARGDFSRLKLRSIEPIRRGPAPAGPCLAGRYGNEEVLTRLHREQQGTRHLIDGSGAPRRTLWATPPPGS